MNPLPTRYRREALLSPVAYLKLRRKNPGMIKRAKLIPPRVWDGMYLGKIHVVFSHGSYKIAGSYDAPERRE